MRHLQETPEIEESSALSVFTVVIIMLAVLAALVGIYALFHVCCSSSSLAENRANYREDCIKKAGLYHNQLRDHRDANNTSPSSQLPHHRDHIFGGPRFVRVWSQRRGAYNPSPDSVRLIPVVFRDRYQSNPSSNRSRLSAVTSEILADGTETSVDGIETFTVISPVCSLYSSDEIDPPATDLMATVV